MERGLDQQRVYDAYIAGRQSAALAVAVRIGLFDLLAPGTLAEADLAPRLGLPVRPLGLLLRALVAMGFVRREGGSLALSSDAAAFLVRGRPGSLAELVDLEVEQFLSPSLLLEALRSDGPSVYGAGDPWQRHAADSTQAEVFTRAMHSISEAPGKALAGAVELGGVRRLLDVAGGSGAISIELARAWPELRALVFDLDTVCEVAREYIEAAALGSRVETLAGDMFGDPFPSGFDAVLFSQILHDWRPETGAELLCKAADALPQGGLVMLHEKLVNEDGSGPLSNALVHLDMLVWTEGQQYDGSTLTRMLESAGFGEVEVRPTDGYWSVVLGRKR